MKNLNQKQNELQNEIEKYFGYMTESISQKSADEIKEMSDDLSDEDFLPLDEIKESAAFDLKLLEELTEYEIEEAYFLAIIEVEKKYRDKVFLEKTSIGENE